MKGNIFVLGKAVGFSLESKLRFSFELMSQEWVSMCKDRSYFDKYRTRLIVRARSMGGEKGEIEKKCRDK